MRVAVINKAVAGKRKRQGNRLHSLWEKECCSKQGNSWCKSRRVGMRLACSRRSKKASMVRGEGSGARRANEGFGLPSEEGGMPLGVLSRSDIPNKF